MLQAGERDGEGVIFLRQSRDVLDTLFVYCQAVLHRRRVIEDEEARRHRKGAEANERRAELPLTTSNRAVSAMDPRVGVGAFILHGDRFVTGIRKGSHGAGERQFGSLVAARFSPPAHTLLSQAAFSSPAAISSMASHGKLALLGKSWRRPVSSYAICAFSRQPMTCLKRRASTT